MGRVNLCDIVLTQQALIELGIDSVEDIQMQLMLVDPEREQLISHADTGLIPPTREGKDSQGS